MYSPILLALTGILAVVNACAAPESKDSADDGVYGAVFTKGIIGAVVFWSFDGYVSVGVALTDLPDKGGPFMYHIHVKPVPASGDCYATLGHFNPYCGTLDAKTPAEKEVGDLSGKHGMITGTSVFTTYEDRYLSLNKKNRAFIGGLSVVIHLANGDRIACADLDEILAPLSGEKAEAAKVAMTLDLPQKVKTLLA